MIPARKVTMPREAEIAITGRCNLKCKYCFYANEMVGLRDLPTEAWLQAFEKLGDAGLMSITLTGGEVFTRRDLFELIDGIIANRMRYGILTNGTLITDELLDQFDTGKRRLRLNTIQVSIDGSTAEIHNKSRPHSFERAIRGLRLLKARGFRVIVRVTVNRHNVDDLENIAQLLLEDIGLPKFSTNEAIPVGSGCQHEPEVALSSQEQLQAMETFKRLLEKYPGRITGNAGPVAKIDFFDRMEEARRTGNPLPYMGCLSACTGPYIKMDIEHDGTIVACHMLPGLKLGNILEVSLKDLWHSHPILNAMRHRGNIPMSDLPGCRDCEWNAYCNGSCPGLVHQSTGDLYLANPQDCYRRFLQETTGIQHAIQ